VDPALIPQKGMDLIQDHGLETAQHSLAGAGAEHEIQAFRGCDQNLGRMAEHFPAIFLGGVTAPGHDPDIGKRFPLFFKKVLDFF